MSLNKKSMAVAAGLILALSTVLTACGGGTDTATNAGADAAKAGADAAKAGADAAKSGADAAKAGGDAAVKAGGDAMKAGGDAMKAGGDVAANAALEKTVSPVRSALVQANTAVGKGDMTAAKSQFSKFETAWTIASPMVKTAAGDKYPMIEAGVNKLKAVMGTAAPKKEEASSALTTLIGALNGLKK
jgi:trimeric autotransporter adhesin